MSDWRDPRRLPPPEFDEILLRVDPDGTKVYTYRISEKTAKVLYLGEDEVPFAEDQGDEG